MKNSAQKFWDCANKILPLHRILKIVQTDPTRTHIKKKYKKKIWNKYQVSMR